MHKHRHPASIRVLFCLLFLAGPTSAEELSIYTWIDYFPPPIIAEFERSSGHKINFTYFYSDLERDTELHAKEQEFDLVVTDAYTLATFKTNNIFRSLDRRQFANFGHLDARWSERCGELGIPFFWGGVGIAYRSTQVSAPVDSWEDLLFPEPSLSGRISMLNETFDLLVAPLKQAGVSANTAEIEDLKKAYQLLLQQRPHVAEYGNAFEVASSFEGAGGLAMAQAYSGDQDTLKEITGYQDWDFVYPKEGTTIWLDCLSIEAHSGKPDLARQFVDYLLEPEIAARMAPDVMAATPNESALKLLPQDYASNPRIFIPEPTLDKSEGQQLRTTELQMIRNKILIALLKSK